MNKILKLALYTLFACAVIPAMADDVDVESTQSVTARMDCKTMKAKIDELNASGATDDTKSVLQETYDAYCATTVAAPDTVVKTTMLILGPETPAETDEEKYARIAANLDAGLCPDGATPNKFGCCGDEVFKDLGNLEFACCPKNGGECFPLVK